MNTNEKCRSRRRLAGLSVLEFIGCLMALVGGAWLGAIYLGIDVRHMAYVALSKSELIEKVPERWRPAAPEGTKAAPTSAELAHAVQIELASLRGEITALRSTNKTRQPGPSGSGSSSSANKDALTKQQTTSYWNRIHEIVSEHSALQMAAETAATEGSATKLAALKARINRFAASALRAVPTENVDKALVALSKELADWHERSGDLYDRAVSLWESAARTQGGAITKDWEFAQLQLRNEARLMGDKFAAVRDSLSRRFGEEFHEIPGP
jgi:hypothetical protein